MPNSSYYYEQRVEVKIESTLMFHEIIQVFVFVTFEISLAFSYRNIN